MVLILLGGYEIKHCRRSLHAKETSHESAQATGDYLRFHRRFYANLASQSEEIYAYQDKDDAKRHGKGPELHAGQHVDRTARNHDECYQNGP